MTTATVDAPPRFLTTEQVSELTGLAVQTLMNWRCSRRAGPPFVRLSPRRVRYERDAVEQWLRSQTINPSQTAAA